MWLLGSYQRLLPIPCRSGQLDPVAHFLPTHWLVVDERSSPSQSAGTGAVGSSLPAMPRAQHFQLVLRLDLGLHVLDRSGGLNPVGTVLDVAGPVPESLLTRPSQQPHDRRGREGGGKELDESSLIHSRRSEWYRNRAFGESLLREPDRLRSQTPALECVQRNVDVHGRASALGRLAQQFSRTQPPASGSELVNCTVVGQASMHGRTINVPGRVNHHSVVGKSSAGRTWETISHTLSPSSISTAS